MTTISALPPAPSRTDPANFSGKADAFVAALPTFGTQANALASEVNAWSSSASNSAAVAIASANFKGNWSSLTGSLAVPASVLHSSQLWLLVSNVADVTAHTPGVSASWVELETLTHAATADLAYSAVNADSATNAGYADYANVGNNAIGHNQTWQNVTLSRALNTVYTNNTGRPIQLLLTFDQHDGSTTYGSVYCGSMSDAVYQGGIGVFGELSKGGLHTCSIVIPAGVGYKATVSNSTTLIYRWFELR